MAIPVAPRPVDVAGYYTSQHPESFDVSWTEFYHLADRLTAELREEVEFESDVLYGTDPSHIMDIYLPNQPRSAAPVFVFLHGGGFREGHPAHYGHLAAPFLETGTIFVSLGYRLEPVVSFPRTADDVVLALRWLQENIQHRGGDPRSIVIGGHSAGAMIAGLLAVRTDWQGAAGLPQDIIRGAVLVSGYYDTRDPYWIRERAATGDPVAADAPTVTAEGAPPTVLAYGTWELNRKHESPGQFASSAQAFARTVNGAGGRVQIVELLNASHVDTVKALGDPSTSLCRAALGLVGRVRMSR